MQIIQFPRKPKPAAPPAEIHSQCRSKNALLEAARTTCVNRADAIFVLIEAHRNAWHQWDQAVPSKTTPREKRKWIDGPRSSGASSMMSFPHANDDRGVNSPCRLL